MEKHRIDFEDVFAPVAHYNSVRTVVAIAASRKWEIYQENMTTAFLNAVLPHSKWIRLPSENFVRIKKALYGLKEAVLRHLKSSCWIKDFINLQ
jgi:Reverse transcriptase (RNA-dependent DNA polymerase)